VNEQAKLEIFVPETHVAAIRDALGAIGVGRIGKYGDCSNVSYVTGTWRPLPGSDPFKGEIGRLETAQECRLEMNCDVAQIGEALDTIRHHHPYETPPVNITALMNHMYT
jgi:hypothetical protein